MSCRQRDRHRRRAGTTPIGNGQDGVLIDGVAGNTVGGSAAGSANLISANGGNGIEVRDAGAPRQPVAGNRSAPTGGGHSALGNARNGVDLAAGPRTTSSAGLSRARQPDLGQPATASRSSAGGDRATVIQGNRIGTDSGRRTSRRQPDRRDRRQRRLGQPDRRSRRGQPDLGQRRSGVDPGGPRRPAISPGEPDRHRRHRLAPDRQRLLGHRSSTTPPATRSAARRRAPATSSRPTGRSGSRSSTPARRATCLGQPRSGPIDPGGVRVLGNALDGVLVIAAPGNLIGGPTATAGNVVSGNGGNGVRILATSPGASIQGNFIGVDPTGSRAVGNAFDGVLIDGSTGIVVVGGARPGVISGNARNGVEVSGRESGTRRSMGTDRHRPRRPRSPPGQRPRRPDPLELIGGTSPGDNLVSANLGDGIRLAGLGNIVRNNQVGTTAGTAIGTGDGIGPARLVAATSSAARPPRRATSPRATAATASGSSAPGPTATRSGRHGRDRRGRGGRARQRQFRRLDRGGEPDPRRRHPDLGQRRRPASRSPGPRPPATGSSATRSAPTARGDGPEQRLRHPHRRLGRQRDRRDRRPGQGNLISGNTQAGVHLFGRFTAGNTVAGQPDRHRRDRPPRRSRSRRDAEPAGRRPDQRRPRPRHQRQPGRRQHGRRHDAGGPQRDLGQPGRRRDHRRRRPGQRGPRQPDRPDDRRRAGRLATRSGSTSTGRPATLIGGRPGRQPDLGQLRRPGVYLLGTPTTGNRIAGNLIGTDARRPLGPGQRDRRLRRERPRQHDRRRDRRRPGTDLGQPVGRRLHLRRRVGRQPGPGQPDRRDRDRDRPDQPPAVRRPALQRPQQHVARSGADGNRSPAAGSATSASSPAPSRPSSGNRPPRPAGDGRPPMPGRSEAGRRGPLTDQPPEDRRGSAVGPGRTGS